MAWIESHQGIATHPKLYRLSIISGLSQDICIAKLHRLWWWSLQYAEDGHLGRYSAEEICFGIGFDTIESAKSFYQSLKDAKFIDEYDRVNDWLDYAGRYLKSKYHTANPIKYKEIIDLWIGLPKGEPKGKAKKKTAKPKGDQPTNQDNLNQPNLTNLPEWLDKETWISFQEMRLQKKKPLTEKSTELILKDLSKFRDQGQDPKIILEKSIKNQWTDVYALKPEEQAKGIKQYSKNSAAAMQMIDDLRARKAKETENA